MTVKYWNADFEQDANEGDEDNYMSQQMKKMKGDDKECSLSLRK